ncbi:MAG: M20/M25/M40 family metallo-hydrolase [Planctomycetes bacterium]|nr:M20/M25/M40 family metallo-hydrolase [Planctomycetota bacterium]
MQRRFAPFPLLQAACLLFTAASAAQQPVAPTTGRSLPADRATGAAAVDVDATKRWLGTLAGPEFQGRGTGQPGYEKAANFVAEHFRSLGLQARGENDSYFQTVPWQMTSVLSEGTKLEFRRDGAVVHTVPMERLVGSATVATDVRGSVVLLRPKLLPVEPPADGEQGRGRRRASVEVQGLEALDLAGKVVVVSMPPAGEDNSAAAMARFAVIRELQGKKCAAVLFAGSDAVQGGLRGRGGMGRGGGGNRAAAGAARSPLDVAFGGEDFAFLLDAANVAAGALADLPVRTDVALEARVQVAVAETQAPAMNVFAVLPGSDPKLADEYVVIGSHLDHLGKAGDVIRPGADDDGSGTTGVMAVAQMLAKNPQKPRRSVLFVCFSGEESGLVGSRWFADHCPIPLSSITAELQMDMIGRDEEEARDGGRLVNVGETAEQNRNSLHLVGTEKLAPALHALCLARNEIAGFELEFDQESLFGRSDHFNFARHGVPIAFFFTGLHKDYHQPSDTPDKIHYEKLLRVATYVYDLAFELAVQDSRPEVDPVLWEKFGGKQGKDSKPAAPLSEPESR